MPTLNTPVDGAVGLQLASPYVAGSGSFALKSGQGSFFTAFPTIVTLITNGSYNTGAGEVLCEYIVTGKTTDTLTGATAVSGFTDQNFATNDYVEGRVSARYITDLNTAVGVGSGGTVTSVATGGGITGGPITTTGTVSLAPITNNFVMANTSGGSAAASGITVTSLLDGAIANVQGDVLFRGSASWQALAPGTLGQVLATGGAAANPAWGYPYTSPITEVGKAVSFNAAADTWYVITGSSAVTATLPTAVGITGHLIRIRCENGYTGLCTLATTSAQTIGPSTAVTQILYAGEVVLLQSNGANWVRVGGQLIPCFARMNITNATTAIAYNTETLVLLNAIQFDNTGLMASAGTNSITVFRTGNYRLASMASWSLGGTVGSVFYTAIYKNTSTNISLFQMAMAAAGATSTINVTCGGSVALTAGDILIMKVFQANSVGSGNLNLIGSATYASTYFELQESPIW